MSKKKHPLTNLEAKIGYDFKNPALALRALTHASYGQEQEDNQRLEFLGDRILGLIVAEHFYRLEPHVQEGMLSLQLNALVRKKACAEAAKKAGLGTYLRLSPAEAAQGGRKRENILGDTCEAFIAALYLDGGLEAAQNFILRFWGDSFSKARDISPQSLSDPKSLLQDRALKRGQSLPVYKMIKQTGPDHDPCFYVEVTLDNKRRGRGKGFSKRAAEQDAAQNLLNDISS